MENIGEGADDQGSGWLEVKKKHRTSSKFSIQNFVGGFSSKTTANFLRSQPSLNENSGSKHARQRSQPSKAGGDFLIHVQRGGGDSTSISNNAEKALHCLDECTVNQDVEPPKSASVASRSIADSNGETGDVKEIESKEQISIIPKIRWGDLEDDAFVLHHETMAKTEIKFGDSGDDNLVFCRKSGDANESVPSNPCFTVPQEDKAVIHSADTEHDPELIVSSAPKDVSLDENYEEMDGLSSKNMEIHHEHVMPINIDTLDGLNSNIHSNRNHLSLAIEEVETMMTPQGSDDKSDEGDLDKSVKSVIDGDSNSDMVAQDSVLLSLQSDVPDIAGDDLVAATGDAPVTASVEDSSGAQDGKTHDELSKTQIINSLGEVDSGESKERFRQRLWCFLFENLNRAVDELYLLCELECDVVQMKEATLVLEEAASDFKELNSRVEEFENVKRSTAHPSNDGMKTDHCRPHALSWEVRRMTNSPHRAEILSSSLEVFKKIQQERVSLHPDHDSITLASGCSNSHHNSSILIRLPERNDVIPNTKESLMESRKQSGISDRSQGNLSGEKRNVEAGRSSKAYVVQNGHLPLKGLSTSNPNTSQVSLKDGFAASGAGRSKRENLGSVSEMEKHVLKKDKILTESRVEKNFKPLDSLKRQIPLSDKDKEKEKRNTTSLKSMDAWKEKRNWEDILASPFRSSSRVSQSSGMSRKSVERARVLHDKLISPEKKKKTALDLKKEAEEKHARALRIRNELENERVQRMQRTSEKLNRVNEWQASRSMKLREGMYARHQRSESLHEAFLAQVVRRAGDESSKVNEVRFITSLNEGNKKLMLRLKLQDSQLRRAEKLQVMKTKQKEDMAREEAVLERKKILEAEKLQRLAETQSKKEEAQLRREEERKASSAAPEAKAVEQLRRKEVRAKAQQEEAELLAQKLAEKLHESEQRRKFYLEQIRERASMDFRDQSSPLLHRSSNKEGQVRSISTNSSEDYQAQIISGLGGSALWTGNITLQHSLKRRIKRIRQRLMALKYEFSEPPVGAEGAGIGNRTIVGTARAKIGRWLHELQRLRQARKEGAASIGLIIGDMMKFLEGTDPELHASRQAGLLDFIASALPASHTSKPEACQVTLYLLRLLRVVLSLPANRSYFLAQNLLRPIIPMLSAASLNIPGNSNLLSSKTSVENLESISEVLDGFLWTVTTIIGHNRYDERQVQMQDGLLELVIAYQVIHRLRDLFALYDRPQAEGSPFPSSILLSLNLLAVLTSRSRTISFINWGSSPFSKTPGNVTQEAELAESAELGSSIHITSEDHLSPLSIRNVSTDVSLPDVPEDRPLDEPCRISKHDSASSRAMDPEKELTDISGGLNYSHSALQLCVTEASDDPRKHLIEGHAKVSVPQKVEKSSMDICGEQKNEKMKQPVASLLSVIAETGLVSLLSLLTAVLLQASNRLSSEQASYVLPSNFEEVATGVLKVLNNLALLDISLLQRMLARPDLKMEFFHLMSFLLSHCTSKWKVATDQVGLLLLESLLLLAYFALFHPENQVVLRWGKSPTILHKVCDLPFVFFSDPELMPILTGSLVAACYECEQNKGVVQQELSTDMMLALLKSCRNGFLAGQSNPSSADNPTDGVCEYNNQLVLETRKVQIDAAAKPSRSNLRSSRLSLGKGVTLVSTTRNGKVKNQRVR